MDTRECESCRAGSLLELTPRLPVSLRLGPGSSIDVTRGSVWLTQEGMQADIVLRAGDRFVVPESGQQVLTALEAAAVACVADVHAHARALRRDELRRLSLRVRSFLSRLIPQG